MSLFIHLGYTIYDCSQIVHYFVTNWQNTGWKSTAYTWIGHFNPQI